LLLLLSPLKMGGISITLNINEKDGSQRKRLKINE
jgi:hypothetical protein